jgi:hypothetical protein
MARHIEAWMDGVRLSDIGAIVIDDVTEQDPEMDISYLARVMRGGQDIQKCRRKSLLVTIHAKIHELYDLNKRNAIRDAIAKWCGGSVLELSNHPDRQLHVMCRSVPGLGAVRDYNSLLDIELEANEIPYWQDKLANTATGSGTTGSTTLLIAGTAKEIPVECTFTPGSAVAALTVTVSCGGVTKSIALSGMSVSSGSIVFGRDNKDRLTIKNGSTSLMRYRSAASADDLIVPAGNATVSWTAGVSGSISFSAKGRWL